MPLIAACACGERTTCIQAWPGRVDVLDEAAAPGQEALIFQPAERLSAEGHGSSWSRERAVASRRVVSVGGSATSSCLPALIRVIACSTCG